MDYTTYDDEIATFTNNTPKHHDDNNTDEVKDTPTTTMTVTNKKAKFEPKNEVGTFKFYSIV